MPLDDYAREIANERDGERNRHLSSLWPLQAVITCAFHAGTLDQQQADRLWDMDWTDDFSVFVGPDNRLIARPAELGGLPAGYFITFIEVDQPREGETEGRRHLLPAMISLGKGQAAGCRNDLIGLPSDGETWQILDLVGGLNWLPAGVTNRYDTIKAMPVTTAKSRPIRLRCRPTDAPRPAAAGQTTRVGGWGNPEPSGELADRIVAAAVATLQAFSVKPGYDNTSKCANAEVVHDVASFR